jgi:hypothetical protein
MSATRNVGACQNVSYLKMSAHAKMSATWKCRRMPKCQLLENVGACQNVSYLKMSALKKYSKFKSKCAYINHSKSNYTCAYINVSAYKSACAYNLRSASKLLLFGLGGLSTLLSFSARLKFSFLFSFSPSEGVAPPPSGPQVGSVHKPAQLIWAPCLPYWHGCLYWHDLSKTCQNVGA